MRRDLIGLDIALLAGAVARQAPEIRPIVDVEGDLSAVRLGVADRKVLRGGGVGFGEMSAGHHDRFRARDIGLLDVVFVERAVGAIVAIEDERESLVVANTEHHERSQPRRVGLDARHVDAFARALLADEAAHVLVSDARDEAALQAKTRRSDCDIGWAAADRLGEARHVLEPSANLRAVEVDGRAAYRDDIERGIRHAGKLLVSRGRWSGLQRRIACPDDHLVEIDI